jgi:hypothetical protein
MEHGGSLLCSQEQPLARVQNQMNPVHTLQSHSFFFRRGNPLLSTSQNWCPFFVASELLTSLNKLLFIYLLS